MKNNPFQKKPKEPSIDEMVSFLENKGYVVRKLKNFSSFSDQAVIAIFYEHLCNQYGIEYSAKCKNFDSRTRTALKGFQKNVESFGYSKQFANFLVVKFLEAIFSNYGRLGIENRLRSLEDVISEKGLWLSAKVSRFGNVKSWTYGEEGDVEWYEDFINRVCDSEDESLEKLKEQRKKELLFNGEKEKN